MRRYGQDARAVDATEGEPFAIDLPGSAGGGYEWVVTAERQSLEVSEQEVPSAGAAAVGAAGRQLFVLKPLRAGAVKAKLELKRRWEPGALESYELVINVKPRKHPARKQ